MKKVLVMLTLTIGLSRVANADPISFAIDCMIHDNQGKLLSDLGMVGALMNGQYRGTANFTYSDLKITADLNGPFGETPEVEQPQLKLMVVDGSGGVLASTVTSATEETNVALLVPSENVYLHCDKMNMGKMH